MTKLKEPIVPTRGMLERLAELGECVVVCYNQATVWGDRKEAAAFYAAGVRECDGAEAQRYMNVLMDLVDGKAVCHDGATYTLTQVSKRR